MNDSLKQKFISGVIYTGAAKYAGLLIALVVAGILSRLIAPKEFGIVAIATVMINFLSLVGDLGISPAIIQNRELTQKEYSSLFALTLWIGAFLSALFFLLAPSIALYFDNNDLINICRILAINLFFGAANIIPNGLMYKEKRFKFISLRTIIIQLTTGVIAVVAAYNGAGIYALLINPTITSIALFVINYQQYPQSFWTLPSWVSIRKIAKFSAFQFLFNLINFFSRNMDKIFIGKTLGIAPLGYYDKSYRLMMMPLDNITNVISPVMFPLLAEYQKEINKLTDAYMKVLKLLASLGFPLSVLLFFNAKELILLIFGMQWESAVEPFRILSLTVGVQIILSSSGAIYQATDNTQWLFLSGILSTLTNLCAILWGIYVEGSIEGVAWGLTLSFSLNFLQCYLLLFKKCLHHPFSVFWKVITRPLLFSVLLGILLTPIDYLCSEIQMIPSLLLKSGLILIGTAGFLYWNNLLNFKQFIHRIVNK